MMNKGMYRSRREALKMNAVWYIDGWKAKAYVMLPVTVDHRRHLIWYQIVRRVRR